MANTTLYEEKKRFGTEFLRKRGFVHLDQITLEDLVDIGLRYGIRFNFKLVPHWRGPWRLDREHREWRRPYGFDHIYWERCPL